MQLDREIATKLRAMFGPRLAVLVFCNSVLTPTDDPEDEADIEELFARYKAWPKRAKMSGAAFLGHVKALYDVYEDPFTGDCVVLSCTLPNQPTAQERKERAERVAEERAAKRAVELAKEREEDARRVAMAAPKQKHSWRDKAAERRKGKTVPISPAVVHERALVWRTHAELAASFSKNTRTWRRLLRKHPELVEAVKRAWERH